MTYESTFLEEYQDDYTEALRCQGNERRAHSARNLIMRADMSEVDRVKDASDVEWLITQDYVRRSKPAINFVTAHRYVTELDEVRQLISVGATFPEVIVDLRGEGGSA